MPAEIAVGQLITLKVPQAEASDDDDVEEDEEDSKRAAAAVGAAGEDIPLCLHVELQLLLLLLLAADEAEEFFELDGCECL